MFESQLFPDSSLEVINYNNDFLLLKSTIGAPLQTLGRALLEKQLAFVEEVIVTEVEICLKLNNSFHPSKLEVLNLLNLEESNPVAVYRFPVYFEDHLDWKNISAHLGLEKEAIITQLESLDFSVAMFGFLPGFVYLNGLPLSLNVPRKKVPAKYVDANSLAMGGKYLGMYSIASPGGWNVIGKFPISVLEIQALPPVALNLGDQIKLEAISESDFQNISRKQITLKEYNA